MPIIGDGDTANDTFIQQLVMNGEAAVYRLVLPLSSAQVLR